jgi:two-component system nitrate/nitrite response regulator NarL
MPTMSRSACRVVVLEDHVLVAESLDLALTVEGYDVRRIPIPEREQAPGALISQVIRQQPRIALLDLDLGQFGNGERLITPLAQAGINVVVITGSLDRARWGETVRCGARKVIAKSRPLNEILATVRRINHGLQVMSREEREDLISAWASERAQLTDLQDRLGQLTTREREVLAHLMKGRTVRDIAAIGVVSEATVRTQVKSILAKLDVTSQIAAVGLAHRAGWLPPQLAA